MKSAPEKAAHLKPAQALEKRLQETFNASSSKDHDELKRKREDY